MSKAKRATLEEIIDAVNNDGATSKNSSQATIWASIVNATIKNDSNTDTDIETDTDSETKQTETNRNATLNEIIDAVNNGVTSETRPQVAIWTRIANVFVDK